MVKLRLMDCFVSIVMYLSQILKGVKHSKLKMFKNNIIGWCNWAPYISIL